jgi:hypothetical protein
MSDWTAEDGRSNSSPLYLAGLSPAVSVAATEAEEEA